MVCCSDASHRNLVAYAAVLGLCQSLCGVMFIVLFAAFTDSIFVGRSVIGDQCGVYVIKDRSGFWMVHGMAALGFGQLNLISIIPALRRTAGFQTLMLVLNAIGCVGFMWVTLFAGILAHLSNAPSGCKDMVASVYTSLGIEVSNIFPFALIAAITAAVSVLFSASVAHGNKLQAAAVTQESAGIHGLQQFQYNQQPQVQYVQQQQQQQQPSVGVRVDTNY